jgi:integrase/recombinase XerD
VQPVVMPFGDPQSWTLVDADAAVMEPVEGFLSHLHAIERSPNTVKAYAHDLRDWFEFLDQRGLDWSQVRLEDVGRFVAWLRLPETARAGNVAALPSADSVCVEATVNRKLGGGGVLRVPPTPWC